MRTARRWEATRKLPVHRVPGGGRSGVFAYRSELEQWLTTAVEDDREAGLGEEFVESAGRDDDGLNEQTYLSAGAEEFASPDAVEAVAPGRDVAKAVLPKRSRGIFVGAGLFACGMLVFLAVHLRDDWQEHRALSAPRETRGAPSQNAEAQELYLRGLYFWNQRTEASLTESVDLFTQSITRDPKFAAAYAGLADSYLLLRQYGHMTDGEAFRKALVASRQALALDDSSHQAHRTYAFLLNYWMWNFPEAQKEFQRSIELSPDDALTHSWYATSLYSESRYQEALQEIETARRLAPDSISILTNRGLLLGKIDEFAALNYLLELEKSNPGVWNVHLYASGIYYEVGDYRNSLEESRQTALLRGDKDEVAAVDRFRHELDQHGPDASFKMEADYYGRQVDGGKPGAMQPAALYARLGDADRALHFLQVACDRRESSFPRITQDAVYQSLKARPEFQTLVAERNTPLNLAIALKTDGVQGLR